MRQKLIVCCAAVLAMASLAARQSVAQTKERPAAALPAIPSSDKPSVALQQRVAKEYGKLPLSFEANYGQIDRRVRFFSRGPGYRLFLLGNEAVLTLEKLHPSKDPKGLGGLTDFLKKPHPDVGPSAVIRMKLLGAGPGVKVSGLEEMPGKSNYFIGNHPKQWTTNVPNYARVHFKNVYPGVDVVYHGNQGRLEYDFVVAPGADPRKISLGMEGAEKVELNADGDLVLYASGEAIHLHKPAIYQESGGTRQEVNGGFLLQSKQKVGFQVGKYDASKPLIIDPVLTYSTFLGGNGDENVIGGLVEGGIAVDANGNAYIMGFTDSVNFPVTAGAFQTKCGTDGTCNGGQSKVFITKLDPTGSVLLYSTYLGGSGSDSPGTNGLAGITVDSTGNAYLTGTTSSVDFPTTLGALKTTCSTCSTFNDAFVTELNSTGSGLVFSTYLGGSNYDEGDDLRVDASGIYVTGQTFSTDFPTTAGVVQTALGGAAGNAFVTKLNSTGSALVYSTYLGGRDGDSSSKIAVDTLGSAYVIGSTSSSNFPTTPNSLQPVATSGGVFKTTNGGTNWGASNSGLTDLAVQALVIDPNATQTVYAGTFALGVFKTVNGGANWTATNSGLTSLDVTSLAIDPTTSLTVYAGTVGGGVFKSTNGGTSWTAMNTGMTNLNVDVIAVDPSTPQTLYAGTGPNLGGVFKSTNGGASWTLMNNGLTNLRILTLAIDHVTPQTLYAGTNAGGVFKSIDGATTWAPMNTGLANLHVQSLAIATSPTSTLYAGTFGVGGGVFKSTDGGATWAPSNNGLPSVRIRVVAVDSSVSLTVYAGTNGAGVFKSVDGGANWSAINTGLTLAIRALAIDPITISNLYAGTLLFDGFVTKLNPSATLAYSTFLGGLGSDFASGVAVDSAGNAYVTGQTNSPDFRTTAGALQPTPGGGFDAFVTKLDPTGSTLVYSTFLGGSGGDFGNDIAVDALGNAWVAGSTDSLNFPLANPIRSALNNQKLDVFVAELNPTGSALLFSTYLGGQQDDEGLGIALDPVGGVYVTGYTGSNDFPTLNPAQSSFGGGTYDAFVLKITNTAVSADLAITANAAPNPVLAGGRLTFNITVKNNGPAPATGVTFYTAGQAQQSGVNIKTESITSSQGTCSFSPMCHLGTLASGASATITLASTPSITSTPPVASTFVGTGAVGGNESDPTPGNNTATVTVNVLPAADLSLSGSDSPSPLLVGANLTYTLSVTNNGQLQATGVALTDTLPAGTTFVSSTPSQGSCTGTAPVSCALGTLASGATATVTIVVTTTAAGALTNNSSVTANEPDPTPNDNTFKQVTDVVASPNTNNAKLNGSYALLFKGFNSSGAMAAAGSFVADGNGNITGGISDTNVSSGVTANQAFTGTYTIGADNRGSMTINGQGGPSTFRLALGALNAQGLATKARFIEFDATGTRGSGVIERQDTTAFSTAALNGDYAFTASGANAAGQPFGAAGRFHADGVGNISLGLEDTDTGGTLNTSLGFTGTYAVAASGRGTLTITFTGFATPSNFAIYVVSANETLVISTDPRSSFVLSSGQFLKQIGPFSNASLNGASVINTTGLGSGGTADLFLGLLTADGAGNATVLSDENNGGTITLNNQISFTYTVAASGRVSTAGGGGGHFPVFYLVSQNKGFFVDTGGSSGTGSFEPQLGGPFTNASASGNYFFGSVLPANANVHDSSGVATLDGAGNFSTIEDDSSASRLEPDRVSAGTYSVAANGRTAIADSGILYLISPSKAVLIDAKPGSSNNAVTVIEGSTVPTADLALTKTASPSSAYVGARVSYTLTVVNNGPNQATGVVLTDVLPAGVTFVSASATLGTCSGTTTVTCSLGSVASGFAEDVSIVVTPTAVGTITNTASVTGNEADPNTVNNTATASFTVVSATDLALVKTATPSSIVLGSNLTYTVTATNVGNLTATGVTITDTLPTGVTFVSAVATQGTCTGTTTVACNLGTLAGAASATVTIVVTPTTAGTFSNTASITLNETDPTPSDNTATASATVLPATAVERYLVADSTSALVSIFNVAGNSLAGAARAGAGPGSPAVSPNGRLAFVGNLNSSFTSVLDLTLNAEVTRIRSTLGGGNAALAALNADGTRLVVRTRISTSSPSVSIVDTSNFTILQNVPIIGVSFLASVVVVNNVAYVCAQPSTLGGPAVFAIDLSTFAVSSVSGSAGAAVFGNNSIAVTPDGESVLALNSQNALLIIDTNTKTVVQTVNLGFFPESIAITREASDPNGVFGYIGGFGGSLHVLDLRRGSPTFRQLIPNAVATLPDAAGIALTADGTHAIVVSGHVDANNNNVFVVDTAMLRAAATGAIVAQFNVGGANAALSGVAASFVETTPDSSAPVVGTLSPAAVVNDAGQTVHITGSNFAPGAVVRIGSMDPLPASNVTSGALDVAIPLAAPARSAADIVVTNPNTTSPLTQQQESGILRGGFQIANSANFKPVNQITASEFGDGTLAILNLTSRFASTTPVGELPLSLAITPDGGRAYVQTFSPSGGASVVEEVNLSTGLLEKAIALPSDTLNAGQFGSMAAVTNPAGGTPAQLVYCLTPFFTPSTTTTSGLRLVVIDADPSSTTFNTVLTGKSISAKLTSSSFSAGLGVTPDGHFAYGNDSNGNLVVFDALQGIATSISTTALGVPNLQGSISVTPDGKSLLLAGGSGSPVVANGTIAVFDISANPLSPTLLATITGTPPAGLKPLNLTSFKVVGSQLFSLDPAQHVIVVFNFVRGTTSNNFSQLGAFVVPGNTFFARSLDITPDGSLIYEPLDQDDAVAVISTANLIAGTPALVTKIGVGLSPAEIAVSPLSHAIADMALTKTASPSPAGLGANLTYTVAAINNGPSTATGVTVTDTLPAGVTFVSATPGQGTCTGTTAVTCNLGTLASGAKVNIAIVVIPTALGTITNTASVRANEMDPNPLNNAATITTSVVNAPTVLLSSTSLSFASQPVGSASAVEIVTLTNNSSALALNFASILPSGDFSETNNCGSSLASLATCNLLVTFTPTAAGTRNGAITIADNGVGSPQIVSLTGIGINSPAITLSPVSLIFSSRLVGSGSPPLLISMSNSGNAILNISSIAITGTNSGDFTETNSCGTTLASGASCTISVVFTPTAGGQRTAGVAISSDARGSVPVVTLTGTGLSPGVNLSSTLLIFNNQTVGTSSPSQTVILSNSGATAVGISSITASGDFAETNTCGNSIAASSNCSISVTFTPTTTGTRSGSVTVVSGDSGSPHTVTLTGTGVLVTLSLSPASLTFHDQKVGSTSQPQSVSLTNTGGAALTITAIAPSGDFLETSNCGASLAPGAACTISVSFLPTTTGTRTGVITVTSNAQGSPQSVNLTGNGISRGPAVSLSCINGATGSVITPCSSLTFPAQAVGTTSAAQRVTLTNAGNDTLIISSIMPSGDFAAASDCGASLAASATCTVSVTFSPAATGTRAGAVTLTDNTGDSPQLISLLGTGSPSGPAASLSTSSVAFGNQFVGTTSTAQVVTLTSVGNALLAINTINASGDFSQTNTCGSSVAPNGTCMISITFNPVASGARAGAITIADNGPGSPQAITLSGNGTDVSISIPPGSQNSATIRAGQSATFTMILGPVGGFNSVVTVSCSGAPPGATCLPNPSSFVLNVPTTVVTTVTTTAPSKAGTLSEPQDVPPYIFTLSNLSRLLWLLVAGIAFAVAAARRRRPWMAAAACVCFVVFAAGCAGGLGSPGTAGQTAGTPSGTYTVTVVVKTPSGASRSMPLTVTVQP